MNHHSKVTGDSGNAGRRVTEHDGLPGRPFENFDIVYTSAAASTASMPFKLEEELEGAEIGEISGSGAAEVVMCVYFVPTPVTTDACEGVYTWTYSTCVRMYSCLCAPMSSVFANAPGDRHCRCSLTTTW